jgi:hypothetical protein
MSNWMERVASTSDYWPPFAGEEEAQIFALYELCSASDAGGLVSYFMSEAATHFYKAVAWLRQHAIEHAWVGSIEEAFGGSVPSDVDQRTDLISAIEGWDAGIDPLDGAQVQFDKARPYIDEAMEIATAQGKSS